MTIENPEPTDDQGLVGTREARASPTPVRLVSDRQIDLADLRSVRRELCRVYRDARSGRLATADASKLAFVLFTIGRLLEAETFEQRLDQLEQMTAPRAHS